MVGETCSHSRRTLHPAIAMPANGEFETQAVMVVAEIVHAPNNEHPGHQGFRLLSKMTSAASQPGQTLSESCIEPLDISRIDHATPLGDVQ